MKKSVVAALCLLAATATAQETPKVAFEKHTLPNGLQLILHVDKKLPMVHVNLWYHVGSKNEKVGRTGFAHLFEHLMFQGSKNAKGDYFALVEKAGASLNEGGVNGTTSQDRTNYFETAPSGNLEYLLWLESDRLATLADAFDQKILDNQRDVVKNERRQRYENTPYGRWLPLVLENLFPAGHPYSWAGIGSHEDLTAASLDDVKEFFRKFYSPNNLSLTIAGDFDPRDARRLVEKYFGSIPTGPALDRPQRNIPTLSSEKIVEVKDRVPQERSYIAWPTPEYFADGDPELELAASILADGLSSRLNKALVYDRPLCSAVAAGQVNQEIAGFFFVNLTARPGASLADIERIAGDEIAKLAKLGPTPAELLRARNKLEFAFVSGLESIGGFGGKADLLNQFNTFLGDPDKFEATLARYRNATREGVRKAVDRWLNTRNRVVIRFHPEVVARAPEVALDRQAPPALGADTLFRPPAVKEAKLENGLRLFVVERPDLPKVAVTLVTRAGSAADPAGKGGLATLTASTVAMGTRTRKALAIEDLFGDLGTALAGKATSQTSQLTVEVLRRNLAPALDALGDVAQHPSFPPAEVERERKRLLDTLAQQSKNASQLAARVGPMLAFGADHPYGRPVLGLPSSVEKLTRDDVARFHAAQWRAGSSALIFVGAVTLDDATALARKSLGAWASGAAPELAVAPPRPAAPGRIYLVDRQDAPQSVVSQLLPAPKRQSSDYDALFMADAVWGGGGFTTRLNLNLREDKGYSYAVFSQLDLRRDFGRWIAGGGVQTSKTKESLIEIHKELESLAGGRPITDEELSAARLTRVRGYAQQFESLQRISGQIAGLWTLGIPMGELTREIEAASKVTVEEARAAAKKYARPEDAAFLIIGDRGKIEAGLREAKLGPIVILDSEGREVAAARATN